MNKLELKKEPDHYYTLTTIREFKVLKSNGSPVRFITEEEAVNYAEQISNGKSIYIPLRVKVKKEDDI